MAIKLSYRNMPNKGAGRDSKVQSDYTEQKLRFWAFQWWFRNENRSIIKEIKPILVTVESIVGPETIGATLFVGARL